MSRDADRIALTLRRRLLDLEKAVRAAEKESAQEALAIARRLSSGPLSAGDLRRLQHPYSTARSRSPQDPAIINVRSGRFRDAWRVTNPRRTAGGLVTRLINTAPYARYLLFGTRRMIARPILKRIQEILAPKRAAIYRKQLRRVR